MALPSSGALSLSDIAGELSVTGQKSLNSMAVTVGFNSPYAITDFYGYSNIITSDITISRYVSGNYAYVQINSSSFEQSFSSNYGIIQGFTVVWRNWMFGFSYTQNYTFYFPFFNTNNGVAKYNYIPPNQNAYIEYGYPTGSPTIQTNGFPVNLTGWS